MAAIRSTSSVSYATRTNTTITAPSGITNNDVLMAIVVIGAASAPTITPPSGFSEITEGGWPLEITRADPWQVRCRLYIKVASGESGNYTFSHSSCGSEAIMFAISSADTSDPIQPAPTDSGQTNGRTSTAPGLTTPRDSSFVAFASIAWDAAGPTTPPTGTTPTFTEYYDGGSTGIFYCAAGVLATAGATGNKSNSNGNSSDSLPWCAGLVCIQNVGAAASSFVIPTRVAIQSILAR